MTYTRPKKPKHIYVERQEEYKVTGNVHKTQDMMQIFLKQRTVLNKNTKVRNRKIFAREKNKHTTKKRTQTSVAVLAYSLIQVLHATTNTEIPLWHPWQPHA